MQTFQFFAAVILCGLVGYHVESLTAKALSKFPFLMNETFHFQILPKTKKGNLRVSLLDTMVIQIVDMAGLVKEKAIFHYGFHEKLDQEFHGSFMKIVKWELNSNASAIDISIIFQPKSNFYIIEIYYVCPQSKSMMKKSLKDLNLAYRIFRNSINLLSPSKVDLRASPNQQNDFIWNLNDTVTVTCRAYGGMPKRIPLFENFKSFAIINSSFFPEKNERMIKFLVRREDHLKTIKCGAGNISKSQIIKVKHRPLQVYIKQNKNKEIDCSVVGGFPTPSIKWALTSGPQDASKFYNITSSGTRLFINEKSPLNSKWEFECQISQRLGSFITHTKRTFSTVVEKPKISCNTDCANKKITNLEHLSENFQKSLQHIENIQTKNEKNTDNLRMEIKQELFQISSLTLNLVKELKQENVNLKQIQKSDINSLKGDLAEIRQKMKEKFINKTEIDLVKDQIKEIHGKLNHRNADTGQNQSSFKELEKFASKFLSTFEIQLGQMQKLLNEKKLEINNNTAMIKVIINKMKESDSEKIGKGYWKRRKWRFRNRQRPNQSDDFDDNDK